MDFVVLELIRELQKLDTYNTYIIAVGPGEDICLQETANFSIAVLSSRNYLLWEQFLLPQLVRKYRADLLHCTSNTAPIAVRTALVLTLHDIIFMERKIGTNASLYQRLGRVYRRFVLPRILEQVDQVITVSHFEKNNILARYPQLKDKVHAVYNGVSSSFRPVETLAVAALQELPKGSYWLFLGNTDPKKNMRNTLLGYAEYLKGSAVKRKLLLIDTDPKVLDILLAELNITDIKPYLIIKDYISHAELPQWYTHAFASLYTSLRESFGLPLIEAMACGTPVIGSNTSAIPEVAEDSILYVDPQDATSIAGAMLRLEGDTQLYAEKRNLGLLQSVKYTWQNTGRATLKIYQQVMQQHDQ